jgi:hypothetical protein
MRIQEESIAEIINPFALEKNFDTMGNVLNFPKPFPLLL